jgi:hypothetical protein
MPGSTRSEVRRRLIEDADLPAVVDCLRRGFPTRRGAYWVRALDRMARRPPIDDAPKYGHLLETPAGIVGVLLVIAARRHGAAGATVRCNLSSWCVDPPYRALAPFLHAAAVRDSSVTYLNVSPAPHTLAGIEALKFERYSDGQFLFVPLLSPRRRGVRVAGFADASPEAALLPEDERALLADHAALGCRALICLDAGAAHPFVFQRRAAFHRLLPCQQLIYCRGLDELARFAGAIGRHLALRGWPLFLADANGPIPGLVGRYFAGRGPKYFKGPVRPALGDLAYTELVILGP